jgi:RNA polymerase sigma factor (TIGR02999 family)
MSVSTEPLPTMSASERVPRLLDAAVSGDGARPAAELLTVLYDELRSLARRRLDGEPAGATLQATALVHEAYLRLVGDGDPGWSGRAHFFGAAAQAMRRILVERARGRATSKRGGGRRRVGMSEVATLGAAPEREDADEIDVLALDEALDRLKEHDERKSRVVLLRYFAGLEIEDVARALDVSAATVKLDWAYSRAWLRRELARGA